MIRRISEAIIVIPKSASQETPICGAPIMNFNEMRKKSPSL